MSLLALVLASCPLTDATALTPDQAALVCRLDAERLEAHAVDRAALAAIYARPEFATARNGSAADLLHRLKTWLEGLFETSGAETFSNVTRFAVLLLAAVAVVLVAIRLRRRPPAVAMTDAPSEGQRLALVDPSEHLARARAHVATDPRAAVREALLAMLAALERQRLARPDRVKTNRELRLELPSRGAPPAITEAVTEQLSWFDRAWYSLEPLDAAAAQTFIEASAGVVRHVEGLGRAEVSA